MATPTTNSKDSNTPTIIRMASLNWVQLSAAGRPIPLPTEEPLMQPIKGIELSLYAIPQSIYSTAPATHTAILSALPVLSTLGTLFVSNERLVFVRTGATSKNVNGDNSVESSSLQNGSASIIWPTHSALDSREGSRIPTRMAVLNTLSIPFTHFVEGKFVQPFFGQAYYHAKIVPAIGGGIDVRIRLSSIFLCCQCHRLLTCASREAIGASSRQNCF